MNTRPDKLFLSIDFSDNRSTPSFKTIDLLKVVPKFEPEVKFISFYVFLIT